MAAIFDTGLTDDATLLPPGTEPVKRGAERIRQIKQRINALFSGAAGLIDPALIGQNAITTYHILDETILWVDLDPTLKARITDIEDDVAAIPDPDVNVPAILAASIYKKTHANFLSTQLGSIVEFDLDAVNSPATTIITGVPSFVSVVLICETDDPPTGFVVGDQVDVSSVFIGPGLEGCSFAVERTAAMVKVLVKPGAANFRTLDKGTPSSTSPADLDPGKWKLRCCASKF